MKKNLGKRWGTMGKYVNILGKFVPNNAVTFHATNIPPVGELRLVVADAAPSVPPSCDHVEMLPLVFLKIGDFDGF